MKIEEDGSVTELTWSHWDVKKPMAEPDMKKIVITAQQAAAIRMIIQKQLKEQDNEN